MVAACLGIESLQLSLPLSPSEPPRLLARLKPSNIVRVSAMLSALAILTVALVDVVIRRDSALEDAERNMRVMSSMMSEQVARTFEAIDRTLQAAIEARSEYELHGPKELPAPFQTLTAIRGGSSIVKVLSWIDETGERIHTSFDEMPPPLNVSAQEHFTVHLARPDAGLYTGRPFRSVIDNAWVLLVSRRFVRPDGSFGGIVQGSLDIDYFSRTYDQMNIGHGVAVALYRRDGTVIARSPDPYRHIGTTIAGAPLFAFLSGGDKSGTMRGILAGDDAGMGRRLLAYHHVPGQPMTVAIAVGETRVLGRWSRSLYLAGASAIALALLVTIAGFLFARNLARNERQQVALLAANQMARAAQESALRASQAKTNFLASMSHELRTPLNSVIGFGQILAMDPTLTEKQRDRAETILKGGHHLLNLVNEVLDMAGIEAGKLRLALEPIDPGHQLADVHKAMAPLARQHGVRLELTIAHSLPEIRADLLRLRQVLLNLVSNAIKYNRTGGTATLSAALVDNHVRFSVADTGRGIDLERQVELFQPFARLGAEHSEIEGTGLGLSLARQLVDAMQGRIGFESTPGRGSLFWIDLPVAGADGQNHDPAADLVTVTPTPAGHSGRSILYIEDNPDSLRLVSQLLATRNDIAMLSAAQARDGLHMALTHRPHIVIVDINLPEMNGYEVLARLKAMPETEHIPVIAFTAAALPGEVKRGIEAGFFRYLTKPIDVNAFFQAIDDAVASRAPGGGRAANAR